MFKWKMNEKGGIFQGKSRIKKFAGTKIISFFFRQKLSVSCPEIALQKK